MKQRYWTRVYSETCVLLASELPYNIVCRLTQIQAPCHEQGTGANVAAIARPLTLALHHFTPQTRCKRILPRDKSHAQVLTADVFFGSRLDHRGNARGSMPSTKLMASGRYPIKGSCSCDVDSAFMLYRPETFDIALYAELRNITPRLGCLPLTACDRVHCQVLALARIKIQLLSGTMRDAA